MFLLSGISTGFKKTVPRPVRDVGGFALQNISSGEKLVNTVGAAFNIKNAGTRFGETLEKAPIGGKLLRTAFDVGAAPLTYISAGIGPSASLGIKALPLAARLPLQFLAPASKSPRFLNRLGIETALGTGATVAGQKTSEAVAKRTDNPFLVAAAGLAGGVAGGVGGAQAAMRAGAIRKGLTAPLPRPTIREDVAQRAFLQTPAGATYIKETNLAARERAKTRIADAKTAAKVADLATTYGNTPVQNLVQDLLADSGTLAESTPALIQRAAASQVSARPRRLPQPEPLSELVASPRPAAMRTSRKIPPAVSSAAVEAAISTQPQSRARARNLPTELPPVNVPPVIPTPAEVPQIAAVSDQPRFVAPDSTPIPTWYDELNAIGDNTKKTPNQIQRQEDFSDLLVVENSLRRLARDLNTAPALSYEKEAYYEKLLADRAWARDRLKITEKAVVQAVKTQPSVSTVAPLPPIQQTVAPLPPIQQYAKAAFTAPVSVKTTKQKSGAALRRERGQIMRNLDMERAVPVTPTGFSTSPGNNYQMDGASTTRTTTAYPGMTEKQLTEIGVKTPSSVTLYVNKKFAGNIGSWAVLKPNRIDKQVALHENRSILITSVDERTGKLVIDYNLPANTFSTVPSEGLVPLELFDPVKFSDDGRPIAFRELWPGDPITKILGIPVDVPQPTSTAISLKRTPRAQRAAAPQVVNALQPAPAVAAPPPALDAGAAARARGEINFSGMAKAMSDNYYERMWEHARTGKTVLDFGNKSPLDQQIVEVANARGLIQSVDDVRRFAAMSETEASEFFNAARPAAATPPPPVATAAAVSPPAVSQLTDDQVLAKYGDEALDTLGEVDPEKIEDVVLEQARSLEAEESAARIRAEYAATPPPSGAPPSGGAPPTGGGGPPFGKKKQQFNENDYPGIKRSSVQVDLNKEADTPGFFARQMYKLPLMQQLFRPGLTMPDNVFRGYNAQDLARAEVETMAFPTRMRILADLKTAFGMKNINDAPNVQWIGDSTWDAKRMADETSEKITGTLYDVMQNPRLYELTPDQLAVIRQYDGRNDELLKFVQEEYGAQIGNWVADFGAAYVPNVSKTEFAANKVVSIWEDSRNKKNWMSEDASKKRTYNSARDRIYAEKQEILRNDRRADQVFDPETDLEQLTEGMDEYKSRSAGSNSFISNLNGLTTVQKNALGPSRNDYKAVQITEDITQWFPVEEAGYINTLMTSLDNKWMRAVVDLHSTILSTDLSPMGQQGMLAVLSHPLLMAKTIAESAFDGRAATLWSPEAFAKTVADDPTWLLFARATGQAISAGRTPSEFAGGLLRKIPKVGESLVRFNDRVYIGVLKAQKIVFDEEMSALGRDFPNMPLNQRAAIAGRLAMEIIPTANTKMAGLSDKQAASLRVPVTSPTFIQRPLQFVAEGTEGLFAMVAHAKGLGFGPPPTARQKRAGAALMRFYTTTATLAATSAALTVLAQDGTPEEAFEAALSAYVPITKNSDGEWVTNRNWMRLQVGDYSIPLGGPMRAIMQALAPRPVQLDKDTEVWIPGAGLYKYFTNRMSPVAARAKQLATNKDFDGNFIVAPDTGFPATYLQYAAYAVEGVVPLSIGALGEAWRTNKPADETFADIAGSFFGTSIQPLSDQQLIAKYANRSEYTEVTPAERERVYKAHPELEQRISSRRLQKNTPIGVLERQKVAIKEAQAKGDEQFRTGKQTLGQWQESNNRRSAQLHQAYELAFPDQKPNENKPWTMWIDQINKATDGDIVNWDAVDKWRSTKSDVYNNQIDVNIGVARSPLQKERAAAIKQLANDDFFDMARYRGLRHLSSRQVTEYAQLVENERLVNPRLSRMTVQNATRKIMREAGATPSEIGEVNRSRLERMQSPIYNRYKKQNKDIIAWTNRDLTYDQIQRI